MCPNPEKVEAQTPPAPGGRARGDRQVRGAASFKNQAPETSRLPAQRTSLSKRTLLEPTRVKLLTR